MLSGDQPYAGHDPTAVLLLSLAGAIATPWLALYGVRLLFRAKTARTTAAAFKSAAALAWAAMVGMYTWGILHLLFLDDQNKALECTAAVGKHFTGYAASFIPLQFGCRTGDGHTVEAVIPSYINLAAAVLMVCAVALTGFAIAKRKEEIK